MASVLEQLGLEEAPLDSSQGTVLEQLGLGEAGKPVGPGRISSPLPSGPTPTADQLMTMELEGIPVGGRTTPSPFVSPELHAPVDRGAWDYPTDVIEAIAHLGKGALGYIPSKIEYFERLAVGTAAGLSAEELEEEAAKAGAWLGPGPQTPIAKGVEKVTAPVFEAPQKVADFIVGMAPKVPETEERVFADLLSEQAWGKQPAPFKLSQETKDKVSLWARAILGASAEFYTFKKVHDAVQYGKKKFKKRNNPTPEELDVLAKELELKVNEVLKEELVKAEEKIAKVEEKKTADERSTRDKRVLNEQLSERERLQKLQTQLQEALPREAAAVEPTVEPTPMREPFEPPPETAAPAPTEPAAKMGVGTRRRFDIGRDTYEMTIDGKRKVVKITPKGIEDVAGVEPLEPATPKKIQVDKPTPPKVEPISEVVKSSEEGLVPIEEPIVEPVVPKPPKTSEQIRTLFEEGKPTSEIATELELTKGVVDKAVMKMELERPRETVSIEDVQNEAKNVVSNAKDLDEVYRNMQELTTRYEENLDYKFSDHFEEQAYRDWGDDMMGKIIATRKKKGLVPEPDLEAPITRVTEEGVAETYIDPTDSGGFSTAKAAEIYQRLHPELEGTVIENPASKGQFVIKAEPGVTLGFGGSDIFQKMYDNFAARIKSRSAEGKKPLPKEASELLERGKIVGQRTIEGRKRSPVYEAELEVLKATNKLPETMFGRAFENPIRTFTEAGGEPLLDMTIHPYHAAENAMHKMRKIFKGQRKEISKGLSHRAKKKVMLHAIAQQKKGMNLLKQVGVKEVPKLKPNELEAYNAIRDRYEAWYTRLNRVRKAIGKEPFPKTDDYFTFIRNFSILERAGFHPMEMTGEVLNSQFIKMGVTPFKFANPRSSALYKMELDPFHVLEIYEDSAVKHIHMSPFVAKVRELLSTVVDPESGKKFKLVNENPVLHASLQAWSNHIAGMKSLKFKLPPAIESGMMRVNSNLATAILGANARSAMIQVSALRNTVTEIGITHTIEGTLGVLHPATRSFHIRNSKVLSQRAYDVSVEDAMSGIRAGRFGEVKKVGAKIAMKPLQLIDFETALATRIGAYKFAKSKLKMSDKRAATYADDLVTRTQASAMPGDIAPVQRSVMGKFLTLFQTFTINDWDFLVKDVLGVRRGGPFTKQHLARAMRFVAATTAFNILFEDVLHIQSPFPTPIRSFRESLERGDDIPSMAWNVGKEFIEPIPLIGAARYGKGPGGPGWELGNETLKYVRQDPMARQWWELGGKWLGVPGTAQTAKTLRAQKRGETPYGQVVGTYTKPEPSLTGLEGLKGLTGLNP